MALTESAPTAIARIYAQSLLDLAEKDGGRERVESTMGELESILELARSNRSFSEFLSSRVIATDQRGKSLEKIFAGNAQPTTLRFLQILNRKGRLGHLGEIGAAYDDAVQAKYGRVEIDVYTAEPLDAAARDSMRARLSSKLAKDVVVHAYTEPSMIGGIKFQIGDQLIDASIETRLRQMRDQIERDGAARLRGRYGSMIEGN